MVMAYNSRQMAARRGREEGHRESEDRIKQLENALKDAGQEVPPPLAGNNNSQRSE